MDKSKNVSVEILKKLYSEEAEIRLDNGEKFEVPKEGSLGLLAIGYKGIVAWRKAKGKVPEFKKTKKDD
ncbi:MAG: hypothetical protein U9Q83_11880 [Bacteroidota bacterium]|nr:hypothetical protein [Bacteroidota bacterium]